MYTSTDFFAKRMKWVHFKTEKQTFHPFFELMNISTLILVFGEILTQHNKHNKYNTNKYKINKHKNNKKNKINKRN